METEIVNTVANSPHFFKLLTEAFVPFVTVLILIGIYRLAHQFIPQLVNAITETKNAIKETREQTLILAKMLERMSDKVEKIEDVSEDNTKRLDAIELTLKKVSDELTELKIINNVHKGSNNVE